MKGYSRESRRWASHTFAGGLLELLAHSTVPRRPPRDHVACLIDIPNTGGVTVLEPLFPAGWDHPDDYSVGLDLAKSWLETRTDLCLEVPSVSGSPIERNIVINSRHPMFNRLAPIEKVGPVYDPRIWS